MKPEKSIQPFQNSTFVPSSSTPGMRRTKQIKGRAPSQYILPQAACRQNILMAWLQIIKAGKKRLRPRQPCEK